MSGVRNGGSMGSKGRRVEKLIGRSEVVDTPAAEGSKSKKQKQKQATDKQQGREKVQAGRLSHTNSSSMNSKATLKNGQLTGEKRSESLAGPGTHH